MGWLHLTLSYDHVLDSVTQTRLIGITSNRWCVNADTNVAGWKIYPVISCKDAPGTVGDGLPDGNAFGGDTHNGGFGSI